MRPPKNRNPRKRSFAVRFGFDCTVRGGDLSCCSFEIGGGVARFSPDGQLLYTLNQGTIDLWHVADAAHVGSVTNLQTVLDFDVSADGRYLRSLAKAPADLHGFVIRDAGDGEHIYGVSLRGQKFVKMTLGGEVVLEVSRDSIPREYWTPNRFSTELGVLLSGMDVAPNGDLYVTDGYSSDYVHRFDSKGKYLGTFGGKAAPYGFNILHKIAMDTRFDPVRIIATDRLNNRVVHLSLDGELLGVVNDQLLLPAAVAIDGDNVVVGELNGRVTILDKAGNVVTHLGTNLDEGIGTNRVPPDKWRLGYVIAAHGVATNADGDVFVSEFSTFGRVHKFDRR